jgi:transposase
MFIRVTKSKNHQYVKVVENYREEGKVKQRVVANLGKLEDISQKEAENISSKLLELAKSEKAVTKPKSLPEIEELDRYNYGYVVYRKLWNRFRLDEILESLVEDRAIEYDFKSVVFSMVVDRLLKPKSKLALVENREDYFGINDKLQLNHIYRSLDILADNKIAIEEFLFNHNKSLFNISTDIVFYDVTTFYYESKEENDLKKFGYSKDGKFGDVQVVMGLMIDKNGLPIGYELFSGNTFDSKTMVQVLDNLKRKFNIDKVVIVADRGLNSKINLKLIKDAGYDYLMASKIKSMSQKMKNEILDKESYINILSKEESEEGLYAYKTINYDNVVQYKEESVDTTTGELTQQNQKITLKEKLVCTYSDKRAKKDRYDRGRGLDKANKIILENQKSSLTSTRNFKKFIQKQTKEDNCKAFTMSMDWMKIKEQQRYDGFYAITTSNLDLDPIEVIQNYRNLYKIEDSFRVLKSTFNTRPIFHYKERRIEAHFILCFIAFMIERDLEIRLKKSKSFTKQIITPHRIREALNALEVSKIKVNNKILFMKSNHSNGQDKLKFAKNIMQFLHIKQLKNISTKEELLCLA